MYRHKFANATNYQDRMKMLLDLTSCLLSSFLVSYVYWPLIFFLLQIVALREQNAHIQRKMAAGEGPAESEHIEGMEPGQKVHEKVWNVSFHWITQSIWEIIRC